MAISVRAQPFTSEFIPLFDDLNFDQPDDVGFDAPFRWHRNLFVIPHLSRKRIHDQTDEFCRKFYSLSPRHHHSYADIGSLDVKGFTSEGPYYLILSHESKGISILIRGDSIRSLIQDVFRLTFYSSEPSEVHYCRTILSRTPTFYRSAHPILSPKSATFRYSGRERLFEACCSFELCLRQQQLMLREQWKQQTMEMNQLHMKLLARIISRASALSRKLVFGTDSANRFVQQHDAGLCIDVDGIGEELLPNSRVRDAYRNIGAAGISLASARNKSLNIWWKEILDSFNVNPELARDDLTWFKTLIGINGGVITALISKSSGNNPKSLPIEIMESFAACCALVGFFASLAGLYLTTNMPKSLPFGCDPEVSTQKMGIVGGLASAFGFIAGVLLLLPNNLFRWITMTMAFAAFIVPIFIKLHQFSRPHPDGLLPGADTNVPFSEADADLADWV